MTLTGKERGSEPARRPALSDVGAALLALVFIYSFAVVFTLNFRPLYYLYLEAVSWPESVNIPMPEIADNYEALIRYNSLFHAGPLEFPTLDLSLRGRIHYEEVKRIFVILQVACMASAACLIPTAIAMLRRGRTAFLKIGGIAGIVLAAAIVLYLGTGWERFFVRFHETFFNNDLWMFDPVADPSILILPNGYFMACAITIFVLVIGLSAASILAAHRAGRRFAARRADGKEGAQ
jgi:integral membrane protein (TIGR01906 family)